MDDKIMEALRQADDLAISVEVDCYDVLNYIDCLKEEIAGLTGKADALKTDKANLERTLEEANERVKEVRKETAKEILQKLMIAFDNNEDFTRGVLGWSTDEGKLLIKLIIKKEYGVEVEE